MKKKLVLMLAIFCCLALTVGILAACNESGSSGQQTSGGDNPGIEVPGEDEPSQEESTLGLEFMLSNDQSFYTITNYSGTLAKVTIPSIHNGLPVMSIEDYAFRNCTDLTSITIPDSVTSIGFLPLLNLIRTPLNSNIH